MDMIVKNSDNRDSMVTCKYCFKRYSRECILQIVGTDDSDDNFFCSDGEGLKKVSNSRGWIPDDDLI